MEYKQWHHSPSHLFIPNAIYIVTAGTFKKEHLFHGYERLDLLQQVLFQVMEVYNWELQAWAILSNHYHFIAKSPENPKTLKSLIQRLHSQSSRELNRMDNVSGRKVWFQYWDTCLTFERSYYARLNYVHNNPVKHGVVTVAEQYPYCSAGWFKNFADASFQRKIESFRYDRVSIKDDF